MCNDYGNHIQYSRYIEAFSQLKLPMFVEGNGPDLTLRDDIRIRDTAPVLLRTGDGVQLNRDDPERGPARTRLPRRPNASYL